MPAMRDQPKASIPLTGPTPLDEIRQAEAVTASQLFQARQEGLALRQAVKKQVSQMLQQAQQDGAQAGQAHCEQMVEEAGRRAAQVVAQGHTQADLLLRQGQGRLDSAAQWALGCVLGLEIGDWQP